MSAPSVTGGHTARGLSTHMLQIFQFMGTHSSFISNHTCVSEGLGQEAGSVSTPLGGPGQTLGLAC